MWGGGSNTVACAPAGSRRLHACTGGISRSARQATIAPARGRPPYIHTYPNRHPPSPTCRVSEKLLMPPLLHDAPATEHCNAVGVANGGEAMRNHHAGAPYREPFQCTLVKGRERGEGRIECGGWRVCAPPPHWCTLQTAVREISDGEGGMAGRGGWW